MSIVSIAAVFGVVPAAGKQGRLQPEHLGPTRRISRGTPGFGTTDRDTIQSPLTSMNASSTIDGRVHLVVAQRLSFFRSKLGQTIDRVVGRHGWGCAGFQPGHGPASIRQYQMIRLAQFVGGHLQRSAETPPWRSMSSQLASTHVADVDVQVMSVASASRLQQAVTQVTEDGVDGQAPARLGHAMQLQVSDLPAVSCNAASGTILDCRMTRSRVIRGTS